MMIDCVHHWRIAEPNGPVSEGRCLHCGATRQYRNWDVQTDRFNAEGRAPGLSSPNYYGLVRERRYG